MEIRCPHCGRVLKEYEIKSRWCNSCNKATGEIDIEAQQRAEEERLRAEEEKKRDERAEELKRRAEEERKAANAIRDAGGYWEYKIVSLVDDYSGRILPDQLEKTINELGRQGWRLRCAYTNEIGRTSESGVISNTNATIDQNILIFERFVKQESIEK